jgi:hypothetical protein
MVIAIEIEPVLPMAMVVALEIGSFFFFSFRVVHNFLNILQTSSLPSNTD